MYYNGSMGPGFLKLRGIDPESCIDWSLSGVSSEASPAIGRALLPHDDGET
jgi:hypothetical protein